MKIEQEFILDLEVRPEGNRTLKISQDSGHGDGKTESILLDKVGAEKLIEQLKEFVEAA